MTRRATAVFALACCALATVVTAACNKPPRAAAGRNVLLIVIDSLRADHVGCYGYSKPTTPAYDAFAAGAVRFANSYATSSWTLPSQVSIFTGLYEDVHRVNKPRCSMDPDNVTVAEVLRQARFDTHAIVCAPFLRASYRINQGFVEYDDEIARTKRAEVRRIKTSREVTDRALSYLKKREKIGGSFFLFVHYWDVHYDYNPPRQYAEMFDPDYRGHITADDYSHRRDIAPGMNPRDLQHIIALYDGEIRYTDDHLRELLAWLDASPLAKNTAVIITSDHGDEFLEHGSTGHTFTCYEELIRVPLVIRAPWLKPRARVIPTMVENVDLFPTMLTLAGVRRPPGRINGYDLVPLIEAGKEPTRSYFFCETRMGRRFGWHGAKGVWSSLRDRSGWKVHLFKNNEEQDVDLFLMSEDPEEKANLNESRPDDRDRMLTSLDLVRVLHNRIALERRLDFMRPTDDLFDQEIQVQLDGLGYLQH
jgi:arylsulfatase A-like enzyme